MINRPERSIMLHLGIHEGIDPKVSERSALTSLSLVEQKMQSTTGKVVFFLETTPMPLSTVRVIESLSKEGVSPASAYLGGIMLDQKGELLVGEEREAFFKEYFSHKEFDSNFLEALEALDQQYPGRLRIMFEGVPNSEIRKRFTKTGIRKATREYQLARTLAQKGEIEKALPHFKKSVQDTASFTEIREALLTGRLDEVMQDSDVSAVVVRIGSAHKVLERSLTRRGHIVETKYDTNERGEVFENSSFSLLVGRARPSSNEDITELAWYQGLIGEIMENVLATVSYDPSEELDYNSIFQLSQSTVRELFGSMDDVRAFEQKVREAIKSGGSFIDVLETL